MPSNRWLRLIAGAVFLTALPASAQMTPENFLKRWDADGDGKVAKSEFEGRRPFSFFDKDGDGFITREELEEVLGGGAADEGTNRRKADQAPEGAPSGSPAGMADGKTAGKLDGFVPLSTISEDLVCSIGRNRKCDIKQAVERGLFETGLAAKFPDGLECNGVDETYAMSYTHKRDRENYHGGIDMPASFGLPMIAIADGVVVAKSNSPKSFRGMEIIIRHTPEDTGIPLWIYTQYAHMDEESPLNVGDRVKMGQFLGPTGNSGAQNSNSRRARRPAIHFAAWYSDKPGFSIERNVVVPVDGWWMDPHAMYRLKPPFDSKSMAALSSSEKDVPIPVMVEGGEFIPAGTKLVWPYACSK